jgi:hypothetical protein
MAEKSGSYSIHRSSVEKLMIALLLKQQTGPAAVKAEQAV